MDRSTINPVSGRTRLQMSSLNALIQRRAQQSSRRLEVPKSEPETEPKSNNNNKKNPSAVEFLLVDQEGNVKKFYIDEMQLKSHDDDPDSVIQARVSSLRRGCSVNNVQCISSDSENDECPSKKGKKIVKGTTTSVLPICIISDDDDEEEQVNGHKDAFAKKIKGGDASTSSMPLKKRLKAAGGRIVKIEMAEKPFGGRIIKKEMMEASRHK